MAQTEELIKREAAIEAIMGEPTEAHYPSWYVEKIKAIPTENATLVRHGRWKRYGKNLGECSECGEIVSVRNNYCPNCGCRMDGGRCVRFYSEESGLIMVSGLVEVVRCRDCKYWGEHISSYSGDYESFCTNPAGIDNYAYPDDFCSYGERKDCDWNENG